MKNMKTNSAGVTLVEVAIASAIMAVLVLAVFAVLASGTSQSQSMTNNLRADTQARDFLQKFTDDFQGSTSTVTTSDPLPTSHRLYKPNSNSYVQFSAMTGLKLDTAGFPVIDPVTKKPTMAFDDLVEYSWELSDAENYPGGVSTPVGIDGVDSDNNGLVDDGQIRRKVTHDNLPVDHPRFPSYVEEAVILRNVTYRGFYVEYQTGAAPNEITVNLEYFNLDPNKKLQDTNSKAVLQGHTTRLQTQRVSRRKP